jgi:hypothetical protein
LHKGLRCHSFLLSWYASSRVIVRPKNEGTVSRLLSFVVE